MHLTHALFRQEIARHLAAIKRICHRWGVLEVSTCMTLMLREPRNAAMSAVWSAETDLAEACCVARKLAQD